MALFQIVPSRNKTLAAAGRVFVRFLHPGSEVMFTSEPLDRAQADRLIDQIKRNVGSAEVFDLTLPGEPAVTL